MKSCKRVIDFVRQRRNFVSIFCRRGTVFQALISSERLRRNNNTFAPHASPLVLLRYGTQVWQLSKTFRIKASLYPRAAQVIQAVQTMKLPEIDQRLAFSSTCFTPNSSSFFAASSSKLSTDTTTFPVCWMKIGPSALVYLFSPGMAEPAGAGRRPL